jgi:hypothetical protein
MAGSCLPARHCQPSRLPRRRCPARAGPDGKVPPTRRGPLGAPPHAYLDSGPGAKPAPAPGVDLTWRAESRVDACGPGREASQRVGRRPQARLGRTAGHRLRLCTLSCQSSPSGDRVPCQPHPGRRGTSRTSNPFSGLTELNFSRNASYQRRHRCRSRAYEFKSRAQWPSGPARRRRAADPGRRDQDRSSGRRHRPCAWGSVRRSPSRPAVVRPLNPSPARVAQSWSLIAPGSAGR